VRYATGWGHTPRAYEHALADAAPRPLKSTTHPTTGEPFVCVFAADVDLSHGTRHAAAPVPVVVKINPLPTVGKRLQALARRSKHHRQWRGYELLARNGIDAAEPLAVLNASIGPDSVSHPAELLLLARCPGPTLLESLTSDTPAPPLARPLGHLLTRLHAAGLWNRDPKPSNLIVTDDRTLTWIDTVGVQRRRTSRHALVRHVLKFLILETRAVGRECPAEFLNEVACTAGLARSESSELTNRARRDADEHADPTPRDNPLRAE